MIQRRWFVLFVISFLFCLGFSGPAFGFEADSQQAPVVLEQAGHFIQADLDRNGSPDQLAYTIKGLVNQPGEVWLSGELQSLVDGTWFTINYTAAPFEWSKGEQTGTIYFYGGEFRRLRADGPFRILVGVRKGLWEADHQTVDLSQQYPWDSWQASDLVKADGPVTRATEAQQLAEGWAEKQHKDLGAMMDKTYVFDRWRMDFSGTALQPSRRLWVDPSGEIFSADEN